MDKKRDINNSLFAPKSKRGLLIDYPELKKHEDLKKLRDPKDLLFVWYFASKSSPFYDIEKPEERAKQCIKHVYGEDIAHHKAENFISGNFDDKIGTAIALMASFNPGPRIRAKKMVEKILSNYEKLIDIDASNDEEFLGKDEKVDWSKKKAYVDTCATVSASLPRLISQTEAGFGIADESGDQDMLSGELLDDFHENN